MYLSCSHEHLLDHAHNLILLDDTVSFPEIWKYFGPNIHEGTMYRISNFVVKEAIGKLRPVSSQFLIIFSKVTLMQVLDNESFFIPKHKFEIVNLRDLHLLANDIHEGVLPEYAYDVIGVVEDLQDLEIAETKSGYMQLLKFKIGDGRYSHKVAIWGELAEFARNMLEMEAEQLRIILISSIRILKTNGHIVISCSSSTKVYVNLEYDDVIKMRQRLLEEGYVAAGDHAAN
ncbi:hypothetical protein POM88_012585 [Heracleum sosnowskyi]|uniref:Replication protein A OB domain-containing protein n=1 Tax=Heracleum sosnowskyi TaxID=360622 RepID=A0AAD8N1V1_9APIA|nr:hypothetical protein POM88_012585 [Heracleum sosnowskyi]